MEYVFGHTIQQTIINIFHSTGTKPFHPVSLNLLCKTSAAVKCEKIGDLQIASQKNQYALHVASRACRRSIHAWLTCLAGLNARLASYFILFIINFVMNWDGLSELAHQFSRSITQSKLSFVNLSGLGKNCEHQVYTARSNRPISPVTVPGQMGMHLSTTEATFSVDHRGKKCGREGRSVHVGTMCQQRYVAELVALHSLFEHWYWQLIKYCITRPQLSTRSSY